MGDEGAPPFSWTSAEPLPEGVEEPIVAPFVKNAGRAKAVYPQGDTFEGSYNEALQKHGRGVYTWSTSVAANPWVPEEGFPGEFQTGVARRARGGERRRLRARARSSCSSSRELTPSLPRL